MTSADAAAGGSPPAAGSPFSFHRATPWGEGGVAVIEIHGGGARGALSRVVRLGKGALPDPGRLGIGDLIDAGGQPIDEVVVGYVPAREAWSGMDTWTLGIHGGHWIQSRACEMLRGLGGRDLDLRGVLRLAVETKALDAPRAAAFELLTAARTERAARFFVRQHSGELSGRLSTIAGLLRCGDREEALALVRETLAGSRAAYRLGHPLRLLIAGRTNAGKSTLLNRLVGAERAVVTADPGTTRDLIEATVAIADYPVVLVDSAGIRPAGTVGSVEREGILRADPAHFDGMLYLVPPPWELTLEDERHLSRVDASRRLTVASMSDRVEGRGAPGADLRLSAVTGEGIAELRRVLVERWIDDRGGDDVDVPCACFLEHQIHVLSRVLQAPAEAGVALDAVRWALVESLLEIWPTTEDPEANSAHGSRRAAASNREPPDDNGMSRREA